MNFYNKIKKISFRGNIPRINDIDQALADPYRHQTFHDTRGVDMMRPGDQDSTGFGVDYYHDKQPPKGTSQRQDRALRRRWRSSTDGEDYQKGDLKPAMESGFGLYDTDSPIGRFQKSMRSVSGVDYDNTVVGPHNMSNLSKKLFDNIRSRIKK